MCEITFSFEGSQDETTKKIEKKSLTRTQNSPLPRGEPVPLTLGLQYLLYEMAQMTNTELIISLFVQTLNPKKEIPLGVGIKTKHHPSRSPGKVEI